MKSLAFWYQHFSLTNAIRIFRMKYFRYLSREMCNSFNNSWAPLWKTPRSFFETYRKSYLIERLVSCCSIFSTELLQSFAYTWMCKDHILSIWKRTKGNFHLVLITKSSVKRVCKPCNRNTILLVVTQLSGFPMSLWQCIKDRWHINQIWCFTKLNGKVVSVKQQTRLSLRFWDGYF